jgi:hypothetical protein
MSSPITIAGIEIPLADWDATLENVRALVTVLSERLAHHSDETGFTQGNGDGLYSTQTQGWLWVLVTPLVAVFSVVLGESQAGSQGDDRPLRGFQSHW